MTGARLTDAGDDGIAVVAHHALLVAADTWPDPLDVTGRRLGHQVWVGDLGAGHFHHVGGAVAKRRLGHGHVDDRALRHHRHAVAVGRSNSGAHR